MVATFRLPGTEDPAETRARLLELIRRLERRPARPVAAALAERRGDRGAATVDVVFPGAVRRETDAGPCTVIEESYPFDHAVGRQPLGDLRHLSPRVLALLAPGEGLEDACLADLLFLDIETTGLGGAGAIAFLVAAARVEPREEGEAFVLRQYLATSPPEEAAVLAALLEDGVRGRDPVLATYNGRTFDAPMLDERATMHRMRAGFDALRHLDLLAVARTGLRGALASCRLAEVEWELLGVERPTTEVSGGEVPAWYFRFLRGGDARFLAPLVAHNALDVLSLGGLAGRLAALVAGIASPGGLDALALGRLYAARGERAAATRELERAVERLVEGAARDDAMFRLAALYKAAGRRDLASSLWRELAAGGRGATVAMLVEVAMHLEHDRRDYAGALAVVHDALLAARRLRGLGKRSEAGLLHRQRRLERRAATATARRRTPAINRGGRYAESPGDA